MSQALLSVEQAAQMLGGVSRWSIYAWLSQGRLRKTKVGSRVMIAECDLQDFIASCNPAKPMPDDDSSLVQKLASHLQTTQTRPADRTSAEAK